MRRSFKRATETPEQKRARLEKQAKEIADSLQRPSTPRRRLTPDGKLRHHGDAVGREALENQRVDIDTQLDKIKAELDARRARDREHEKSREKDREQDIERSL